MNKKILHSLFKKQYTIPGEKKLSRVINSFNITERVIFYAFAALLILTTLTSIYRVSDSFMVEVPAHGGTLTEGIIGSPRFINPLLATGDANFDLTSLIYSGLLKHGPNNSYIPDLAKGYSISDDGLVYTFVLKDGVSFHDGSPVTADDVLFTIERAQDAGLKSPRRANWQGVTAEKIDEHIIKLTLKQAYAPFLENTTMGILPKSIWQNVSNDSFPFSEENSKPIGSGPYKVASIKRTSVGAPISYTLTAFDKYALGKPFIDTLNIKLYNNEADLISALNSGAIESAAGISPEKATALVKSGSRLETTPLPRVFGVFFNQNQAPVFAYKEVRLALDMAVDKEAIVNSVLQGFGSPLGEPVPANFIPEQGTITLPITNDPARLDTARAVLLNAGWKYSTTSLAFEKKVGKKTVTLAFNISTSNAPELKATADALKAVWTKLGAKVDVKIFEPGDLDQNVIRPRKYDSLLFGEIVGRDLDLFAFWHSSQRSDPGLNIALYTNIKADKLLEQARSESDEKDRLQKIAAFQSEIDKDRPAVFLYAPDFIYVIPDKIKGFEMDAVTVPGDRFSQINKWYTETDRVWNIFAN